MTVALGITGRDLIRALGNVVALPAVDDLVRERAEAAARRLAGPDVVTRVLRRGAGRYSVEVSGADLFAREFGSVAAEAAPVVSDATRATPPRTSGPTLPLQGRVK